MKKSAASVAGDRAVVDLKSPFTGVKVFSATMPAMRESLGETVSEWIEANPQISISDIVVSQSSDAQFHCISISVFYAGQRAA